MQLLNSLANTILAMPRVAKRIVALIVDISLCILTVWISFYIRLDIWVRVWDSSATFQPEWAIWTSIFIAIPIFISHGFYRVIFRYSDLSAIGSVLRAFALYSLIYVVIVTIIGLPGVPRSIGMIQPMLLFFAVSLSRAFARIWLGGLYQEHWRRLTLPKALIYGAGTSGRQLAAAMYNNAEIRVVGYLDDNDRLQGHVVNGLPVYNPNNLINIIAKNNIHTILLAMPSLSRQRRNQIISMIREAKVAVRSLPSMSDLAQGKATFSDLYDLDIDDLLSREAIPPNSSLLAKNISNKVVLVTGAGGSIGSELCRQIQKLMPRKLLLIEQNEYALYKIYEELKPQESFQQQLVPLLASIQDETRLSSVMRAWQPHTIYHAAAYKHVPIVEHNPTEGIKNNVFGTLNLAKLASEHKILDFVLVSTDKAVRPTNVMGASKRVAELILQALADHTKNSTRFTIVRFGNVLGSSGSVVPLFRKQIQNGGPITVTHPDVTRYFMTIPEASQLVIQAGAMGKSGEVYVLDMGKPVKIIDLAYRVIELSGFSARTQDNPNGDMEVVFTGLRPGEKLFEELLIGNAPQTTEHERIMKANEEFIPWNELLPSLNILMHELNHNNVEASLAIMKNLVSGYCPHKGVVDWVQLERHTEK